jgi:uncharacterized protein YecT (DUF1311 family)
MTLSKRLVLLLSLCCISQIAFAEDVRFTKQYSVCMDKSDGVTSNMIDCIVAETKHQDARSEQSVQSIHGRALCRAEEATPNRTARMDHLP